MAKKIPVTQEKTLEVDMALAIEIRES